LLRQKAEEENKLAYGTNAKNTTTLFELRQSSQTIPNFNSEKIKSPISFNEIRITTTGAKPSARD
jgi:hypothetical protein